MQSVESVEAKKFMGLIRILVGCKYKELGNKKGQSEQD